MPLAPVWGMLGACQTLDCTFSLRRGPPVALAAALAGGASADAVLRRALRAAGAGEPAAPFADVAVFQDESCAVLLGDSGVAPPGGGRPAAAAAASAAAAAAAHAATLTAQPSVRELLFGVAGYLFPPATGAAAAATPAPPRCNPGSVRLSAVEWRFAPAPLHLLARLAMSEDAWLWAYSRDLGESLGGWERYLRDLTRSGAALLHRESCLVQHGEAPSGCAAAEGGASGPATAPRVRSEASWVLLDGFTHKRSVSAGEEAAARLGPGAGFSGHPPVLPAAANLSFFKLVHWWPGYDLDASIVDVRGVGIPPIVSFVLAPQPRTTWLLRTFGESWVIACYMIFSGAVISVHALSVCWSEARHRQRMMVSKAKAGGRERRDRLGSANSRSSGGEGAGGPAEGAGAEPAPSPDAGASSKGKGSSAKDAKKDKKKK